MSQYHFVRKKSNILGKRFLSTFTSSRAVARRLVHHSGDSGKKGHYRRFSEQASSVPSKSNAPDTYWQDADFDDIMEEELNEFILNDEGEKVDYVTINVEQDARTPEAEELAQKYGHIEGVREVDLDAITDAEVKSIELQDFFIYKCLPVETLKDFYCYIHVDCGVSWMAITIAAPWITKALVVLPLAIKLQKMMEQIAPTQQEATQKMKEIQIQFGHDKVLCGKKMQELKKKYGYNPAYVGWRMLGTPIIQAPLHMTFFYSLRTMWPRFPDWKEAGTLWFTDLAVPDPTWALPVMTGCLFLLNIELNTATNPDAAQTQKVMKNVMRCVSFMMVPLFIMFPAGFNLYGLSNIAGFAVQSRLLKYDPFRKKVGLKPSAFLATINAGKAPLPGMDNFGKKKENSVKITIPRSAPKIHKVPVKKEGEKAEKKYRSRRKAS